MSNKNPYRVKCGQCFHLERCQAIIGKENIKPENDWCDFDPSRWMPSKELSKMISKNEF